MIDLVELGKRISTLRKKYHLSQNDLAEVLYVTRQAVSKWENGKSMPLLECLCDISILFDVSVDFLIGNLEIDRNDYAKLFERLPRSSVILGFLNHITIDNARKLFPLLTNEEKLDVLMYLHEKKYEEIIGGILYLLDDDEQKLWSKTKGRSL